MQDIGSQMACASVCHIVRCSKFNEPDRSISFYQSIVIGYIDWEISNQTMRPLLAYFAWGCELVKQDSFS